MNSYLGSVGGFKDEVAWEPGLERGAGMSLALGGKQPGSMVRGVRTI